MPVNPCYLLLVCIQSCEGEAALSLMFQIMSAGFICLFFSLIDSGVAGPQQERSRAHSGNLSEQRRHGP